MNIPAPQLEQQEPRNLFRPAGKNDFPKKYIHKSTVLVAGDTDRFGDPYYVWVTAAPRKEHQLELRAYLGDGNTQGFIIEDGEKLETRECFAHLTVANWLQAKQWLGSLYRHRCQLSEHSDKELEQLAGVFRKLRPEWFKAAG